MLTTSIVSTCLFQFSHKTRQTMLLYAYFTPKVDFKRKFNHYQSFLYKWRLTARTIRKFRIGPSIRIESRIGRTIRNWIESRSFAGPYSIHQWLTNILVDVANYYKSSVSHWIMLWNKAMVLSESPLQTFTNVTSWRHQPQWISNVYIVICQNLPFFRYIHCKFCLSLYTLQITHGDIKV